LSERRYYDEYDEATTERCERALITLIGDLGPWGSRIYLAGGLAPRYLVGRLPEDARVHVGTTDVDLVIGLALGDEMPETYRTLRANLKKSGFDQGEPTFTLLNAEGDPEEVGHVARESAVAGHEQVQEALVLLEERFADVAQDGPHAYAGFLARPGDQDEAARLRQEAVATVRAFLRGFRG
jgi:hypothetical protein